MANRPRRARSLAIAAAAQAPIMLGATILTGFAGLAALLVSGRTVRTLDICAAAVGAVITAVALLWVVDRMARAGDDAVDRAVTRRDPPTSTRAFPAVQARHTEPPSADPPDYAGDRAAAQDELRAAQARVDRAHPARHVDRRP